jgi:hypothetical protein
LAKSDPQRDSLVARLGAALGLEPEFFRERWHFSNIHDVMTSLATHGKALPAAMTPGILQEVNALVGGAARSLPVHAR